MQKPILLFDIMETLVSEPFYEALPGHFGMTLEELLEAKHPTAWVEFEKGEISEEEYLRKFFRDFRRVDTAALHRCLWDHYEWLDGMHPLISELHAAGCEIHALSNYPVWFEMIEEKLRLSRYLNWTFVSWKTGLRKPDPRAFLNAAKTLDVSPEQCLFVDDRPANVDAARALGMDAVRMTGAEELRRELKDRDVV